MDVALKDPALVIQSANAAVRELEKMQKAGANIPMSEYTKILIWEANTLKELYEQEFQRDKLDGWEVKRISWCGQPYNEFKI